MKLDDKEILIIIGAIVLIVILSMIIKFTNQIKQMNRTLEKIAKQIGVPDSITGNIDMEYKQNISCQMEIPNPITGDVDMEVQQLVLNGQKIKAIKRVRMLTGAGLKEAKEYVDALSSRMGS